jgi:putative transposase
MPQSLASVLVHLVYSTKNRVPSIMPEIEGELYAYQGAVLREMDCPCLTINGTADHLHMLFSLARTVALSDLVEEVKKRSSKWLKTKSPTLRSFQWQTGYGAFSIGRSGVEGLKRYIADQKEHHRKTSFEDEYRSLLKKYQVDFDERYVWD